MIIVGGGIGGLTAALGLARRGFEVEVLERDPLPDLADVLDQLLAAGCVTMPTSAQLGDPRPGDEDLQVLVVRRTTFEWVLRCAVADERRHRAHRRRRAGAPRHPGQLGVDVPETIHESSLMYLSRWYRFAGDREIELEAIGGVRPMTGLLNRLRRFVGDDGQPLVPGFHAIGDSHTTTNPLYGRGCSIAGVAAGRDDGAGKGMAAVFAAGATDPIIGRGLSRFMNMLATPLDLMGDADLMARMAEVMADPDAHPLPPVEGPTRAELLDALGLTTEDPVPATTEIAS